MSVRKRVWLCCDGCDDEWAHTRDLAERFDTGTVKAARAEARERGWTFRKGKDFCDECSD